MKKFDYDLFPAHTLKQINEENQRRYVTENGDSYFSVTTALSYLSRKGIQRWRNAVGNEYANQVSRRAANFGTAVHNIAEKYLLGDESWSRAMPTSLLAFNKIRPFVDKNITKIYGVELRMYSPSLRVAGTADCICEYNGKATVLDFKTSSKKKKKENIFSYFLQGTAYAQMVYELYDVEIEQIVILMSVADDDPIEFVEPVEKYLPMAKQYFRLYSQGKLI